MLKQIALLGTVASVSAVGVMAARREFRRWGIDPTVAAEALPGDELVAEPTTTDTRSIKIAAPPEQAGPGSSRWATSGPAGTATTRST